MGALEARIFEKSAESDVLVKSDNVFFDYILAFFAGQTGDGRCLTPDEGKPLAAPLPRAVHTSPPLPTAFPMNTHLLALKDGADGRGNLNYHGEKRTWLTRVAGKAGWPTWGPGAGMSRPGNDLCWW
jgi:hypothetical protein